MPDSKRFLHPEAIKRISRMDLRARHIVEGFLSGMHRSPYFGQSIEFLQHRQYTRGDEIRHIDWKAFARHGQLTAESAVPVYRRFPFRKGFGATESFDEALVAEKARSNAPLFCVR